MIQINSSRAAALLLVATLGSGAMSGLVAQPAPQGSAESGTSPDAQTTSQEKNGAESASTPIAESPEPTEGSQTNNSPYDYQSSEEISEDRSVSFPVDI